MRHRELGNGIIRQIAPRGGNPLVYVRFEESGKDAQFNAESFKMGLIRLQIPLRFGQIIRLGNRLQSPNETYLRRRN